MYLSNTKLHKIYTKEDTKDTLNRLDNERYIKNNNTDTLAWGHKDIPQTNLFISRTKKHKIVISHFVFF